MRFASSEIVDLAERIVDTSDIQLFTSAFYEQAANKPHELLGAQLAEACLAERFSLLSETAAFGLSSLPHDQPHDAPPPPSSHASAPTAIERAREIARP